MSPQDQFDRYLSAWLAQEAAPRAPHALHVRFGERLEQSRQRPSWATAERWFPMDLRTQVGALPRLAMLLLTLGLLAAVAASTFVAASSGRSTEPTDRLLAPGPAAQPASTTTCGQPSGGSTGGHHTAGQPAAPPSGTTVPTTKTPSCTAGSACDRGGPNLGGLDVNAAAKIGLGAWATPLSIGATLQANADVDVTPDRKKTRHDDASRTRTKRHLASLRVDLDARLGKRGGCDCERQATRSGLRVDGAVRVRNVAKVTGTVRARDGLKVRAKADVADPVDVLGLLD